MLKMSEILSNKTCGECKHFFLNSEGHCKSNDGSENAHNDACSFFDPKVITNGDVIRQMSNAKLAELIVPKVMFCDGCPVKCAEKDIPKLEDNPFGADIVDDVCKQRVENWLNAPAESEGEDE
jgi:hypothetical protein